MTERLVKPIHVLLQQYYMILHTSPSDVKVDEFDADVMVSGVPVKENRTSRKMGHVKSFMKDFVFDIVRSFLYGDEMQLTCTLLLDCIFLTSSGPSFPVVNAEPLLHR